MRSGGGARVLFLGRADCPLVGFMRDCGDRVLCTAQKIDTAFVADNGVEFIVSFGYRHLIRGDVLAALPGRVLNLHISLLPFNRGADPNFWSAVESTPSGVSIHHVDEGLDTGDLVLQRELEFDGTETMRTSYARLIDDIEGLFRQNWTALRGQDLPARPQGSGGSFHRSRDKQPFLDQLERDWLAMTRGELCERYAVFSAAR